MNIPVDSALLHPTTTVKTPVTYKKTKTIISPITEIIEQIKAGRMVVLLDDEDRENEGDLVMAAEHVTADAINFMSKHGRGLICLTVSPERGRQLNLSPMVSRNGTKMGTNFTASIEAAAGVSTGISAADRAHTIQTAVRADARPMDIVSPGHVFPLIAESGGVLVRAGHTEAGCDIARLANLEPSAVICEILKDNGEMARLPDLLDFAAKFDLKIGTIADLINYRSQTECLVSRVAERIIETPYGSFQLIAYQESLANELHLALVKGEPSPERSVLVRVHEPLSVVDLLDASSKKHSWSLPDAMRKISQVGEGVIVMLRREEKNGDVINAIQSAGHPSKNQHTLKDYGIGAQILRDLGVLNMRLMAEPRKMPSMSGFGLNVTDFVTRDS
ncbi:bifunctional 3,4-dihydroxy-2-butanone-4-phosphate synthase/GTP cyclohydrolase II [Methylophilus methylotrophus]|uniref:bifunctional 3,4-dihydroxy-2-butanone-4-phosphate synthase/GTP cyclohydrolase II n=1 Tax=Methylophilus methylotrophus TaxID=17 RepID=UPI00036259C3|nr:bifunctional 3,4-dihydroxy-2-butanone-4-phosphate synthase/GTP cyclohydrolase II [Methylophilus methylotrophus]